MVHDEEQVIDEDEDTNNTLYKSQRLYNVTISVRVRFTENSDKVICSFSKKQNQPKRQK